jgi:hypothetical protein
MDEAYGKRPLQAPPLGEQPLRQRAFPLSDQQIIVGFLCGVTLLALGILYRQSQAQFYVHGIRWESLGRFCRVSFVVKNTRSQRINARALIRVFRGFTPGENEYTVFGDLTGFAKVPIRLAKNESREVVADVPFSRTIQACNSVDITRLDGRI